MVVCTGGEVTKRFVLIVGVTDYERLLDGHRNATQQPESVAHNICLQQLISEIAYQDVMSTVKRACAVLKIAWHPANIVSAVRRSTQKQPYNSYSTAGGERSSTGYMCFSFRTGRTGRLAPRTDELQPHDEI